jgi:chromosome segregation ATPase
MKQANALREENLLLTQTCANIFSSAYNELSLFLHHISAQLTQIHPCSTSCEYIENEQKKYNQLATEFSNQQIKFEEFSQQHSSQLLTLISNNQQETEDIQRCKHELEQEWNRIKTDLTICQNQLSQARTKSVEFKSKLESVQTWFDDTSSLTTTVENHNEFEHIRIFKERLDNKYIDIINLKQDYTNIEQQNEHVIEEKVNPVKEQFIEMDSKWTQLNDQIQEQ